MFPLKDDQPRYSTPYVNGFLIGINILIYLFQFLQLLQDPEKCRRFGDAGRRRVEETFSWTAIAHQTIDLYKQLVEQRTNKLIANR